MSKIDDGLKFGIFKIVNNVYYIRCNNCKKFIKFNKYNTFLTKCYKLFDKFQCIQCRPSLLPLKQRLKISKKIKSLNFSDERRKNISIATTKAMESEIIREKIRNKPKSIISEETRKRLSLSHPKSYPKSFGEKISKAQKGILKSKETRLKMSESAKKRKRFPHKFETILKIRFKKLERMQNELGHDITPSFNPISCIWAEYIGELYGYKFMHGLNGGEFYIKELGYWVDGYDKINNIVFEYDEKEHFKANGLLKDKDVKRQNEIISFLKCKFIRLTYDGRLSTIGYGHKL